MASVAFNLKTRIKIERQQHKYQELKVAVVKASESLTKDAMNQLSMSAMDFSQND